MYKTAFATQHTKPHLQLLALATLAILSTTLSAAPKACEAIIYPFEANEVVIPNQQKDLAILVKNDNSAWFTDTNTVHKLKISRFTTDSTIRYLIGPHGKHIVNQGHLFYKAPGGFEKNTFGKVISYIIDVCSHDHYSCLIKHDTEQNSTNGIELHPILSSRGPLEITGSTLNSASGVTYLIDASLNSVIKVRIDDLINCNHLQLVSP
ncbi:hypothetical protein [Leeia oryzae]|uniref:hypothetical protein n=1 Tax=Leeia oryzae TaxID=356662 RepID=UPI0003704DC4|nr:hypothetical protein [Leeia oryzae]